MTPHYVKRTCLHCNGTGGPLVLSGEWMQKARRKAGLTLREVARRAKFSAAFVSDCELGRRAANAKLEKIYLALTHYEGRTLGEKV